MPALIFWGAVFVIMLIAEITTMQFVTIWFAAGAVGAFIAAMFELSFTVQMIIFVALSVLLLLITRPVFAKLRVKQQPRTNADLNIGETAVVGNNCTIYHQVTLGGNGRERHSKRHPTVGNNVLIGAGAKILGPVTIGDNSMIGSGSVVLGDVPPNSTVTGIKARVIKTDGERVESPSLLLEHQKIIDPVAQEIAQLRGELEATNKRLAELEAKK